MRRAARRIVALGAGIVVVTTAGGWPAPAGGATGPKLLGPVLSRVENVNTTLARDGGFSAPLPNGFDFWVFADSPRYEFRKNQWRLAGFVTGSTAGMAKFTAGRPLTSPLSEIRPGAVLRPENQPAQFMPAPAAYMTDGSGKRCLTQQGGPNAFSVRWPTGAAMMPDKTNVLVPYAVVCVRNFKEYTAQGWGFSLFNYKRQKFTVGATDVIKADKSGAAIPSSAVYGSPIIVGHNVTFYSWACCGADSAVYRTTVKASAAALKRRTSYTPQPVTGLPATYDLHVAPRSKTHNRFSMYVLGDAKGAYRLYASSSPSGAWTQVGSGVLPRCNTSPSPCHSMALHPELSPAGRLVISYHVPAFGPGIPKKHPYPHDPLRHVVSASLPCQC
jgi:hypothetical protein